MAEGKAQVRFREDGDDVEAVNSTARVFESNRSQYETRADLA